MNVRRPGAERLPPWRGLAVLGGCFAVIAGLMLWVTIEAVAAGPDSLTLALIPSLPGLGAASCAWLFLRAGLSSTVLTPTELLTPRPWWGNRRIPLGDIQDVGMRYHRQGRFPGWRLYVRDRAGDPHTVRLPPAVWAPGKANRPSRGLRQRGPAPSWDALARSAPGQAGLAIYRSALQVQGDTGALAKGPWQPSNAFQSDDNVAHWFADGRLQIN